MSSPPLLETRNISFERDDFPLFSGVSFQLHPGRAIQVTGANGTGKTTLLRILAGSLMATEGEIAWRGKAISRHRASYQADILYLGHSSGIKSSLTPRENLDWYFRLFPTSSADTTTALENVNLQAYADAPCHTLSAGQQRRVSLARLYLSSAQIWILDEPFTSIDVHGVALLETLMQSHLARGGAIILTSHQQMDIKNLELLELETFALVH